MTFHSRSSNHRYAALRSHSTSPSSQTTDNSVYARLPTAPKTASPVPHLTSLYHFDQVDEGGDCNYPGNCGGKLIRDLLTFFKPSNVFDPMTGSGTCRDVCQTLQIPCTSLDIRYGFDATDPTAYRQFSNQRFDFVWAHPPYWRQKLYTDKPGDLSRTTTLAAFLEGYSTFIENCAALLSPQGTFAILIGDYFDREERYVPLTYHTKRIAFAAGLRQRMNANKHTNAPEFKATDSEDLLTKDDLAKKLRLKRRGVECLVARRVIPVIRISQRCVRFSWRAVREALQRHEIKEVGRK